MPSLKWAATWTWGTGWGFSTRPTSASAPTSMIGRETSWWWSRPSAGDTDSRRAVTTWIIIAWYDGHLVNTTTPSALTARCWWWSFTCKPNTSSTHSTSCRRRLVLSPRWWKIVETNYFIIASINPDGQWLQLCFLCWPRPLAAASWQLSVCNAVAWGNHDVI